MTEKMNKPNHDTVLKPMRASLLVESNPEKRHGIDMTTVGPYAVGMFRRLAPVLLAVLLPALSHAEEKPPKKTDDPEAYAKGLAKDAQLCTAICLDEYD